MKKIGINLHGALLFVFLAHYLRDRLLDDLYFPVSRTGRGLTQKLSFPHDKVAIHLATSHYTDIVTIDEETDEGLNMLFSFSLESFYKLNGPEIKHPEAKICHGLKWLPNSPDFREVHDAFFKAYFMAGAIVETTEFEDIGYPEIVAQLEAFFRTWKPAGLLTGLPEPAWVQGYLAAMKKAIER